MRSLLSYPDEIDFLELAPENWIGIGGRNGKQFRQLAEHYPLVCHGLSLSIGSPSPLDENFVLEVKSFLDEFNIDIYSEHLSYCSDGGHLYDLMPIPFTEEAVHYVAARIKRVQALLERRITMENVSYYAAPSQEMTELEFLNAVLAEADCDLLLDVNNVYVNSINHGYDAQAFLAGIKTDKVRYIHIAGHYDEAEDLKIDSHGADVIDPVWTLLDLAYQRFGSVPTLLERDFNFPDFSDLLAEINKIKQMQS
tara:strand:- start:22273 stop:23031 length:759 start_codon:yes stop_codon:yes gene_type:complete